MKYIVSLIGYLSPMLVMAQDGAPAAGPGVESLIFQLGIIFIIFYFLLIRPQQKKFKAHQAMATGLKKGDKVITGAGFVGTVTKAAEGDRFVTVEIAQGVEVQMLRSSVSDLADKPVTEKKK